MTRPSNGYQGDRNKISHRVLQGGKTSGRGKAPNTQLRDGVEALGRGKVNQNPNQKLKMKEGHSANESLRSLVSMNSLEVKNPFMALMKANSTTLKAKKAIYE